MTARTILHPAGRGRPGLEPRLAGTALAAVLTGRGLVYLATVAALAAGSALACRPAVEEPSRPAGDAPPNILLVVVDTLGAEHVSAWAALRPGAPGVAVGTTPHLDALAEIGVPFTRAYSTAPWTQPAIASLFSGRMPSEHGLVELFGTVAPDLPWVPELLAERGYATAGIVSHRLVGSRYGFERGFEHWSEEHVGGHRRITSRKVTDAALAWLDQWAAEAGRSPRRRPFFLYTHYFDPHYVYRHHPEHDRTSGYRGSLEPAMDIWQLRDRRPELTAADVEYLTGLYREEVAFTDAHIGRLLAGLERLGLGRDTAIVVTADHGEELMRHGWIGHTRTLYEELIHVPLVIVPPGWRMPSEPPPRSARTRHPRKALNIPVSLADLAPTLLELGGFDEAAAALGGADGLLPVVSLKPFLDPQPVTLSSPTDELYQRLQQRPALAEVSFSLPMGEEEAHSEKTAYKIAAINLGAKAIRDLTTGSWELYDLQRDPDELSPLEDRAAEDPLFERLIRRVQRFQTARESLPAGESLTPDTEEIERLRALGYLR